MYLCVRLLHILTLTVLVTTIDAQWEGMGDVVNFQKFSTLRVNVPVCEVSTYTK